MTSLLPPGAALPARVLLLLGQSPFDPTSGAAQSMRQIAHLLARLGATVRSLSTTATEGDTATTCPDQLAAAGAADIRPASTRGHRLWRARLRGIDCELIEVDHARRHSWEHLVGEVYEARLQALRRDFQPQLVLTFGGDPTDATRRAQLHADGARVIFALHSLDYLGAPPPPHVDAFLAPSRFLADRYTARWSRPIAVLPPPLDPAAILAPQADPVCVTFINPEPVKGAALVARLAQRLGRERPRVPLLVVGGRAPADALEAAARCAGFSLTGFANLFQAAHTLNVAEIWSTCRVLLAPSIVEEAAGRVALEAMLNGAVPLVSDRGGLPEMLGPAGHVLALPASVTPAAPWLVPDDVIDRWWQTLCPLLDDDDAFAAASARARERAAAFTLDALAPAYARWFASQLPGSSPAQ